VIPRTDPELNGPIIDRQKISEKVDVVDGATKRDHAFF
jgi:hypothetical protein